MLDVLRMININSTILDRAAIGFSGVCLAHCLLLPILASLLPFFGSLAENELIHKFAVLGAIPVTVLAWAQTRKRREWAVFLVLSSIGIGALILGAFIEAFHDYERALTLIGALSLAFAHGYRWYRHSSRNARPFAFEEHL